MGVSHGTVVENSVPFLPTLTTELPFDPEVPLRGISSKELKASTGTSIWALVFLEALFTVAEM